MTKGKYHEFWESKLGRIHELIQRARADNEAGPLEVPDVRRHGHRESWYGSTVVRGPKLVYGEMAHMKSLGKVLASDGVLGDDPNHYRIRMDKDCRLFVMKLARYR